MVQPSALAVTPTPQSDPGSAPGSAARPEDMNAYGMRYRSPNDELFRQLRHKVEQGVDRSREWRTRAKFDRDAAAGYPWSDDDKKVLAFGQRQEITFNRMGRNIDFMMGTESTNRDELTFLPRNDGDVVKSEILSSAVQYINDETDSLYEVSDAFRDLNECGMGWTETFMDYRNFKNGLPRQSRRDCLAMYWDPFAIARNIRDAEWIARAVPMPMYTAMRRYPGINPSMLNAFWLGLSEDPSNPSTPERQTYTYDDNRGQGQQPMLDRVTLLEVQWKETREVVEMEDLFTGERRTMKKPKALAVMRGFPGRYRGLPREKYVYFTAVLGGMLLSKRELEDAEDFTFHCMTGKRDSKYGGWFGIVRPMLDPQMWFNKWLSQIMHVMNRNAKGGVVAETGAFTDPVKAEREWGMTGSFTWAEPGTVTENRYKEKDSPNLPTGLDRLLPTAAENIQDCGGVPAEALGGTASESDAGRSAVFEEARREAGLVVMQWLLEAKRLHTKHQGRVMLRFILKFMNDGRLVRILDEGQEKYVPMVFRDLDSASYDVIVSEASDSPNQRLKTWRIIQGMMDYIAASQPGPDLWATIVRASPLPSKVQNEFVQHLMRQKEQQQNQQPQLEGRDAAAVAKLPAEIEKLVAEARLKRAQEQETRTQAMLNLAKTKGEQTGQRLDALEGIRETIAVQDAAQANRLKVQEYA